MFTGRSDKITYSKHTKEPRIVVFDMSISRNSPAGSCVLVEVEGLREQYPVTVITDRFDGGDAPNTEFVRVPLPRRPIFLRYLLFQALAGLRYLTWRLTNPKPLLIQTTQGQFIWSDVAYAHFCHGAYLKGQWKQSSANGPRRLLRWTNHRFNALMERQAFSRARVIVAPSLGLQRELGREYPDCAHKVVLISNPVDHARFARPHDYDRSGPRADLGFDDSDVVFAFVALGDFARKGLGLVLSALAGLSADVRARARVLVVGGGQGEIAQFKSQAKELGVADIVRFTGMQQDVRPFLWVSDVLAFPSAYEIFSLAILQAAAAGLPPIISQGLYGAEEFVEHGLNGWVVPRDVPGVRDAMNDAIVHAERLPAMSQAAREAMRQYSQMAFKAKWHALYARLMGQ